MPFGPKNLVDLDTDLSQLVKIPGFPGCYINRQGEVFTIRKLRQFRDRNGYLRVSSGKLRKGVHWLLARAFKAKAESRQSEVRHLDGNPTNNSLSNLAWGTRAENAADMARHGTMKGSKNPRAILDEQKVVEILNLEPDNTAQSIANLLGVSRASVSAVLSGQNWSHFTGIKPKPKKRILAKQAERVLVDL